MCNGRTTRFAFPLAFLALACAAATLGGCTTATVDPIDDLRIIGSWRALEGEATFTFTQTGIYTISVHDVPRPVVGAYAWDKSTGTLTVETRRESSICGDDTGVYRVRLGENTLDAEIDRDSCSIRSKLLSQPLRRVGAR